MKNLLPLVKKEIQSFFYTPIGYVFAGLLMIVTNWLFFNDLFLSGQADLTPYWTTMIYLFSIFIPAITMNSIAEERKNGTWEILLSLPIREVELVLAKFIGGFIYLLFIFLLTLPTVVTIGLIGKPDIGVLMSTLLGVILLSGTYLSFGIFISGLTNQPIVAFLLTAVGLILNTFIGQEMFLRRLPNGLSNLIGELSLTGRVGRFYGGLIEVQNVVFFLSFMTILLLLTILYLKARGK